MSNNENTTKTLQVSLEPDLYSVNIFISYPVPVL